MSASQRKHWRISCQHKIKSNLYISNIYISLTQHIIIIKIQCSPIHSYPACDTYPTPYFILSYPSMPCPILAVPVRVPARGRGDLQRHGVRHRKPGVSSSPSRNPDSPRPLAALSTIVSCYCCNAGYRCCCCLLYDVVKYKAVQIILSFVRQLWWLATPITAGGSLSSNGNITHEDKHNTNTECALRNARKLYTVQEKPLDV